MMMIALHMMMMMMMNDVERQINLKVKTKMSNTLPKSMVNFEWATIKNDYYPVFDRCKICTPLVGGLKDEFCRYNCVFHRNCFKTLIANETLNCVNCSQDIFRFFKKLDNYSIIILRPHVRLIDNI